MSKVSFAAPQARLRHLTARAEAFWQALGLREKRLLAGAALALAALLVWSVLIGPALAKLAYWQAETPKVRAQAQALDALLGDLGQGAGPGLEQQLRQSLHASGLDEHYQLQPPDSGNPAWQLTFDKAPADAVVGWLLGNPRQLSLNVIEARLQRGAALDDTRSTLSGTVRMDQAPGAKEAS